MTKFFLVTIVTLLFYSCKPTIDSTKEDVAHTDSLLKIIKSPELAAVNKKLLENPNDPLLYNERGYIYLKYKQTEEAMNDAKRSLRIDSTNVNSYLLEADIFFSANETHSAKDVLDKIIVKFPKNTDALLKLGELLYFVKQYELAFAKINEALKINQNLAKAYYIKGSMYKETGDTAKAVSSLETAIEQDNKNFGAFLDLGLIYANRKNPIALEYYNNALALNPQSTEVLYAKAKLFQDINKTEEAIAIYNEIIKIDPLYKNAFYNIGAIELDLKKDINKALEYFTKAINADPKYAEAYYARGVCYQILKDKNNAYSDFNMCLQLKPNFEPAVESLNKLGK